MIAKLLHFTVICEWDVTVLSLQRLLHNFVMVSVYLWYTCVHIERLVSEFFPSVPTNRPWFGQMLEYSSFLVFWKFENPWPARLNPLLNAPSLCSSTSCVVSLAPFCRRQRTCVKMLTAPAMGRLSGISGSSAVPAEKILSMKVSMYQWAGPLTRLYEADCVLMCLNQRRKCDVTCAGVRESFTCNITRQL